MPVVALQDVARFDKRKRWRCLPAESLADSAVDSFVGHHSHDQFLSCHVTCVAPLSSFRAIPMAPARLLGDGRSTSLFEDDVDVSKQLVTDATREAIATKEASVAWSQRCFEESSNVVQLQHCSFPKK